jgi:ferredoxin-nitrate reductase
MQNAELVIVQDAYHPTETGQLAHVLLPAAQWAEREGTMTNSERRISLLERSCDPAGEARPDWQILAALAKRLGFEEAFNWPNSEAVFEEYKGLTIGRDTDIGGVSYKRLRKETVQWPCPTADHPGTPRLYADGKFPNEDGRAWFCLPQFLPIAEEPDTEFPLVLTTGRLRDQWHTMTRTGHIPALLKVESRPFLELHPDDAATLGVADGQLLQVRSRRGMTTLPASLTNKIRPGTVFAPFHWGTLFHEGGTLNDLTNSAADPSSKQPELKACAVEVRGVSAERIA